MRCFSIIGVVLVVASLVSSHAGGVRAEMRYRERIEYFDISSRIDSRRALWQAIRDWGPSRHHYTGNSNNTIVGQAKPRFSYKYNLQERGGGRCYFRQLNVDVAVVIRLPAWHDKHDARPDLQRYYQCIFNTVTVHEKRHAQIAYEAGEEIEARFNSELDGSECRGFDEHAQKIFNNVLDQQNRRQMEFDRRDYARNRYQMCATGSQGPLADVNSRPQPARLNSEGPLKWREAGISPDLERQQSIIAHQPAGSGQSNRSGDFALETTKHLLVTLGYCAIAVVSFGILFAVVMFGASRYEKYRGHSQKDLLSDSFSHLQLSTVVMSQPEMGQPEMGLPKGGRPSVLSGHLKSRSNSFGKRGREQ